MEWVATAPDNVDVYLFHSDVVCLQGDVNQQDLNLNLQETDDNLVATITNWGLCEVRNWVWKTQVILGTARKFLFSVMGSATSRPRKLS